MSIARKKKLCIDCHFSKYLFSGGRCEDCWKKTQVATNKEKRSVRSDNEVRKPIAKQSQSLSRRLRIYNALNATLKTTKQYCEAKTEVCTHRASETHHIAGRQGEMLYKLDNLMRVCHACHEWIHSNDAEARKLGFLKSRLETIKKEEF